MIDTIHLQMDREEGSLQRLIGLIERRGFTIERMVMEGAGDARTVAVCVRPRDAGRHVDVLGRQIDKMLGMRRCEAYEAASPGRVSWTQ